MNKGFRVVNEFYLKCLISNSRRGEWEGMLELVLNWGFII